MVFDYVGHVREHIQISIGNPIIGNGPDLFSNGWESVPFFRHHAVAVAEVIQTK